MTVSNVRFDDIEFDIDGFKYHENYDDFEEISRRKV